MKDFADGVAAELRIMGMGYSDTSFWDDPLGGQYRTLAGWKIRHSHKLHISFYTDRYFGGGRTAYVGFGSKDAAAVELLTDQAASGSYVRLTPNDWAKDWDVVDGQLKDRVKAAAFTVHEDWRPRGWVWFGRYLKPDALNEASIFVRTVIYAQRDRPFSDKSSLPTEGVGKVKTRRGQAGFRDEVIELWGRHCALTDCRVVDALDASHIDAWATNDEDRLSAENGLPMVASAHRLFDNGWISFTDDGLLISKLSDNDLAPLGLSSGMPLKRTLTARQIRWIRKTPTQPSVSWPLMGGFQLSSSDRAVPRTAKRPV